MDFARKQLEKYGWTDGKGLGKHEDGISQPLKPKLKRSVTGVGHDPASDFNEHWWCALYDKAAKNVEIENKNGKTKKIKINNDNFVISSSTWKINHTTTDNKAQYSEHFVRTSVLTNDHSGRRTENVKEEKSEIEDVPDINVVKMTDEELFAACEGRTAHKGARHGLKALGKLARIAEQEQMFLVQPKYEGYSHAKKLKRAIEKTNEDQVAKTKKKKKKVLENGNTEVVESNDDDLSEMDRISCLNNEDCGESITCSEKTVSKRKKKKRKTLDNGDTEMADSNDGAFSEKNTVTSEDNDHNFRENKSVIEKVVTKTKKKNKFSENYNTESNDDSLPEKMIIDMISENNEDSGETCSEKTPKSKKKIKYLENGNTEISSNGLPEIGGKKSKTKKQKVVISKKLALSINDNEILESNVSPKNKENSEKEDTKELKKKKRKINQNDELNLEVTEINKKKKKSKTYR